MRRFLSLLLAAALCLGLFGCGEKAPEYDRNGVLLSNSLEMAELAGVVAENFEVFSYSESMMEMAKTFTCLSDKEPNKAWITDVGNIGPKVSILHANLGDEALACASALTQSALVQLPEELDDTYGVLLRYRDGDAEVYALVVYDPLEGEATSVSALAVFPYAAEILIDQYFDDAEVYDDDEIEELCEENEDISLTAEPSGEKFSEKYYKNKALEILETVADGRGNPKLFTSSEEVLDYCDLWADIASEEPTDIEVWMLEDTADYLSSLGQMEDITDRRMEDYLNRAVGVSIPLQFSGAYGASVVASCSIMTQLSEPIYLGPAPEDQEGPVLVVLSFDEEATAVVCIYDSGYGLNQYSFAFLPGELEEDLEEAGFERF